jgi:hypothetical protein
MRFVAAVLACLGIGSASGALADPPSSPPQQSSVVKPAAATTTPATEADTAKVPLTAPQTASVASSTAAVDPEEKRLLAKGYRMQMQNGEKVFCRRVPILGSRLEGKLSCGTARDIAAVEEQAREGVDRAQRAPQPRITEPGNVR